MLAEALGPNQKDVVIATKFGYRLAGGKVVGLDSTPARTRPAVEGSLRRLRRDHIDILYQHRQDPAIPVEDVVGAMPDLVRQGKVRDLELSAVNHEILQRAESVAPIEFVQNEYSLIHRAPEDVLLPYLAKGTVQLVCYSPLGRGILTGNAYPLTDRCDYRRNDARFEADNLFILRELLRALWQIALSHAVAPAAVALAWLLSGRENVDAIPGPRTIEQLEDCLSAARLPLTSSDIAQLDDLTSRPD
ncbi:aldo/keto reductase [Bradyrhizobium sp. CCBAU 51753]|uniref:aldo/keto reductase n=1 Tax=Bradyrhizobium sp. CCBAU 51753 TaxID=1325100 RepID=UPI00188C739A|nr:aldo/keto reductase [Bradyrhizobium sp. CCBAU 51753]QOZ23832.1 aldo/keto reductase [Bradyrhizobium sp. CCBAU 51753]